MSSFLFFDTETTGLEPGSRIVEIAAIITDDDLQPLDRFAALVNPGMPIPPDAVAIHGITDAMVSDAPDFSDVMAMLAERISNILLTPFHVPVWVAQNAPFDVGTVSYELTRAGLPLPPVMVADTCAMAKAKGETKKNNLAVLYEHYGIVVEGDAHRAARDAEACRILFGHLRTDPLTVTPWAPDYQYVPATGLLADLPELIASGGCMNFRYVDAKSNTTERVVKPYGWAAKGDGVYFHGLDVKKQERRTFRADRVIRPF